MKLIESMPSGKYRVDLRSVGLSGSGARKVVATLEDARDYVAEVMRLLNTPSGVDSRRLTDLVNLWYEHHGSQLKDARYRYMRTLAICRSLSNPLAVMFSAADFSKYRVKRLRSVGLETVNQETRYLRAVFNELKRLGFWDGDNPLGQIRTFRVPDRELAFLTPEQQVTLLSYCSQSRSVHLSFVVRLCLMTGARWGEANGLAYSGLLVDRVRFVDTKNGRVRALPVKPSFVDEIRSVGLDPDKSDRVFLDCRSAFRRALAASGIRLPRGQMTHVLRHTFASRVLMGGGSLSMLQEALGHSDPKTTRRYAHLSAEYMDGLREFFD